VDVYTFPTTPAEEAKIAARIEEEGEGECFPGTCVICTTSSLRAAAIFEKLGFSLRPSGLGKVLVKLQSKK